LETLTYGFEVEVRGGDIPIDYNQSVGSTLGRGELIGLTVANHLKKHPTSLHNGNLIVEYRDTSQHFQKDSCKP
jgi:hypothetical protein